MNTASLPQGLLLPICFPDEQMTHQLPAAFPDLLFVFSPLFSHLLSTALLAASDGNQLSVVQTPGKLPDGGSQNPRRDFTKAERGSGVPQVTQLLTGGRPGESLRILRINCMRVETVLFTTGCA